MIVERAFVSMSPLHLLILCLVVGVFVVLPIIVGVLIALRVRPAKPTTPPDTTGSLPVAAEVVDERESR
jgi:hypothetical protein